MSRLLVNDVATAFYFQRNSTYVYLMNMSVSTYEMLHNLMSFSQTELCTYLQQCMQEIEIIYNVIHVVSHVKKLILLNIIYN